MTGIDTNVLVRYLVQDDSEQSRRATLYIDKECSEYSPGFIGLVVLVETVWVSESLYDADRRRVSDIVRSILTARQLVVEQAETVWKALQLFEAGKAGFSDCLVASSAGSAGCTGVVTFDKRAAKAGMTLLK